MGTYRIELPAGMEHAFLGAKTWSAGGGFTQTITSLDDTISFTGTEKQAMYIALKDGFEATLFDDSVSLYSGIKWSESSAMSHFNTTNAYKNDGLMYGTKTLIKVTVVDNNPPIVVEPVITTEVIEETETVNFKKVVQDNHNLELGVTNVIQEGVNGVVTVSYEITYTDGVETSRIELDRVVTTSPVNEITEVGRKSPDAPIVYGRFLVNGLNVNVSLSNSESGTFTGSGNTEITVPVGDYEVSITPVTGYEIIKYTYEDRYSIETDLPFTPTLATETVTISQGLTDRNIYTEIVDLPEPEFSGFNQLYRMSKDGMISLSKERFKVGDDTMGGTVTDLGVNVINILELPFPLKNDFIRNEQRIILGTELIATTGELLITDRYEIIFSSIVVPNKYNNSYDYLNTEIKLHLPFMNTIDLPVDYVIGQTIGIKYSIDLYTGDTDVTISSSKTEGEIFASEQIKLGRNIPFIRKTGESVVSPNSQNGLNNEVYTPFIEVVRNKPYISDSKFNTTIPVETILQNMTGFVKVDNVELRTKATSQEKDMIKRLLTEGVFINE